MWKWDPEEHLNKGRIKIILLRVTVATIYKEFTNSLVCVQSLGTRISLVLVVFVIVVTDPTESYLQIPTSLCDSGTGHVIYFGQYNTNIG